MEHKQSTAGTEKTENHELAYCGRWGHTGEAEHVCRQCLDALLRAKRSRLGEDDGRWRNSGRAWADDILLYKNWL